MHTLETLHVLEPPVRVLGLFYVQCSCGWMCDGSLSIGEATSTLCGVERAQLEGIENRRRFQRAQRIAK